MALLCIFSPPFFVNLPLNSLFSSTSVSVLPLERHPEFHTCIHHLWIFRAGDGDMKEMVTILPITQFAVNLFVRRYLIC